jgi:hypothetical protein
MKKRLSHTFETASFCLCGLFISSSLLLLIATILALQEMSLCKDCEDIIQTIKDLPGKRTIGQSFTPSHTLPKKKLIKEKGK